MLENQFKEWIKATKNDKENVKSTLDFLRLLLLVEDESVMNIASEIIVIIQYLESDDDTVSLALESSVAALVRLLAGGGDDQNKFDIAQMRNLFNNKEEISKELTDK